MIEQLRIRELGDPILRTRAREVSCIDFEDPDLQGLIDAMLTFCERVGGMGLAAPQVGFSLRLFVMMSRPNARYPDAPVMEPTVVINPRLVSEMEPPETSWEGCLSIPGIRGLVARKTNIEVGFMSRKGEPVARNFTDFIGRIFLHELDHLDGIVFLDHTKPTEIVTDQEYLKLMGLVGQK